MTDTTMDEQIIDEAKHYIEDLFSGNADGHDAGHSLRVYQNAMKIAEKYPESNKTFIALSSLLHDADDHKLFDTTDNMNTRSFLKAHHIESADIEKICGIINGVSFSKNKGMIPESIEGKIVQDADRLDALGAIGIARTFAYGGRAGRSIESSLQHFEDKLLMLKDQMNTEEAKRIAESRHAYMKGFLKELQEETDTASCRSPLTSDLQD